MDYITNWLGFGFKYNFKHGIVKFIVVDCLWGEWKISECSTTCGDGERTKTRNKTVDADHGGEECSGFSNGTERCNVVECPGKPYNK